MRPDTVVVTGGSGAIGRAVCKLVAATGRPVVNLDLRAPAELVSGETFIETDLTDLVSLGRTAAEVASAFEVCGLVNNAGALKAERLEQMTLAELERQMRLNMSAPLLLLKAFLPSLERSGRGRVVNVGSRASLGKDGRSAYGATKFGLMALARSWALELGPRGITVNGIAPGAISTDLWLRSNDDAARAALIEGTALRRLGSPDDVARAIAFFLSPENGFVTGQVLYVCGGLSLGR